MDEHLLSRRNFLAAAPLAVTGLLPAAARSSTAESFRTGILAPAEAGTVMPDQVFFRGQSATVQMRNAWGIRHADGMLTLAALVDTSGYSTGVQQRYQLYLITEVALRMGDAAAGHTLPPGAYGAGFLAGQRFVAMDLGAHDVAMVESHEDRSLARPRPLAILEDATAGRYRLYDGRSYVALARDR